MELMVGSKLEPASLKISTVKYFHFKRAFDLKNDNDNNLPEKKRATLMPEYCQIIIIDIPIKTGLKNPGLDKSVKETSRLESP